MQEFFMQVMDNTMKLYNLESPFFGLTFLQIAIGFFVVRLAVGFFRWFFAFPIEREKGSLLSRAWGDKSYSNKGGNNA